MRRAALEALACPHCFRRLQAVESTDPILEGVLKCERDDLLFPVQGGIPRLVRLDRQAKVEAFAQAYSRVWQRDGWGGGDTEYLLSLPERDTTGRQTEKWRVKARSMQALFALLDQLLPIRILDLGAGIGWLSHHLAERGHEVYSVDPILDDVLGLGTAGVYLRHGPYFERVWGELERPPFQRDSLDAVVCNASLHYTPAIEESLEQIQRILRPGGTLILLNSPVHKDKASARRAQADFRARLLKLGAEESISARVHHLVRAELELNLSQVIGPVAEVRFDPGRTFRLTRKLKGLVLGMELASFPIITATKGT